jgi:hypothetical protein
MDPREQAAQSMMQAGIGSLGARESLPRFTNREEAIAREHGGHPDQLWDQNINRIISEGHQKQDRWEELGGPNYNIIAPGKTLNMPQYPVLNKGKIGPGWLEAGIPATNQGYKVMNASDPTGNDGWIDRLGRWLFNDPYDKESDESLYQGTEEDKLESEYGTEGTGEFYPDKILRDLYPQVLGEQAPYTSDQELNNLLEGLESEDLGMEPYLEAQSQWKRPENLEKTIQSLELRPEFEGWTHDEIKYWLINQARANRGGIIGLL